MLPLPSIFVGIEVVIEAREKLIDYPILDQSEYCSVDDTPGDLPVLSVREGSDNDWEILVKVSDLAVDQYLLR